MLFGWEKVMKNQRKIYLDEWIYVAAVMLVGALFVFFYREFLVYSYDIDYHRIFTEHLFNISLEEMHQLDSSIPVHAISYPLYHLVLKFIAILMGNDYHWASYIVLAGVNVLSIFLFRKLIAMIYKPKNVWERIGLNLLSIVAIVFVVARSPLTDWRYYDVQCAANPLHNPTVLFVRPFGIVAFIAFVSVFLKVEKNMRYGKELAIFGVAMILSILAKPNFAFAFLPAMGLFTLFYMIRKKTLKTGLNLLATVLPSGALLIAQFMYLSANTEAVKTQFIFGGFTGLNPIEVVCASIATFPVVIILFSVKEFKNNSFYRLSIIALVVGWLEMFLLTNGPSGDFSWGYDLAVQFATVVSIACSMNNIAMAKWRKYVGYLVFVYQVFCGVQYIIEVHNYGRFLI